MNRDPRYRARLNALTTTLESANQTTQAGLWSFEKSYLEPCLTSISTCLEAACYPCIGARRERARARQRKLAATARGRPEFVFDFYNDEWDNTDFEDGGGDGERSGLLGGWGADELDRLLAGSGAAAGEGGGDSIEGRQPKRKQGMSYGAVSSSTATAAAERKRRKSTLLANQGPDPTILPGSSIFGFLERLPWRIGGRGVRYKPSAADLQENPGRLRVKRQGTIRQKDALGGAVIRESGTEEEHSALLDSEQDSDSNNSQSYQRQSKTHRRNRSDTTTSRSTQNSLSSRGDLFPSEDEAADAVPLDDSFALSFTRRSSDNETDSHHQSSQPQSPDLEIRKSTRSPGSRKSRISGLSRIGRKEKSNRTGRKESDIAAAVAAAEGGGKSEMVHSPVTPITPTSMSVCGNTGDSGNGNNNSLGERSRSAWSIGSQGADMQEEQDPEVQAEVEDGGGGNEEDNAAAALEDKDEQKQESSEFKNELAMQQQEGNDNDGEDGGYNQAVIKKDKG